MCRGDVGQPVDKGDILSPEVMRGVNGPGCYRGPEACHVGLSGMMPGPASDVLLFDCPVFLLRRVESPAIPRIPCVTPETVVIRSEDQEQVRRALPPPPTIGIEDISVAVFV